jgi:hypothetical protein
VQVGADRNALSVQLPTELAAKLGDFLRTEDLLGELLSIRADRSVFDSSTESGNRSWRSFAVMPIEILSKKSSRINRSGAR